MEQSVRSFASRSSVSARHLDESLTVPEAEVRQVLRTYAAAMLRAETGTPALGYAILLQGLGHADRTLAEGQPWARALVDCWRNALDRFSEKQQVRDE